MPSAQKISRVLAAIVCGGLFSMGPVLTVGLGIGAMPAPVMARASDKDTLVFSNGRVIEGKITKETADRVWIEIEVAGIRAPADYAKSDILSIVRAEVGDANKPAETATATKPANKGAAESKSAPNEGATKVYVIELEGWFGEEISQTPIRQAVQDAGRNQADYIIFVMDNDWSAKRLGGVGELPDDVSAFDFFRRAEEMAPVIRDDVRRLAKQPKVVFWVKKAMGGAAFLPFNCSEIYFASDAKMGGIGHLNKMFENMGDEVVREKQRSLRMARAEGMAIHGGYDPRIIRAMARDDYVLSVSYEGGRPVLLERYPESIGETLLTDDGKDERADNDEQLARGEGNDMLTLSAELAYKLGISKGTVDTLDDLLFNLGLARSHQVVKGQSAQIMKNWRDGLDNAKRELRRLMQQWNDAPNGGATYQERTQNRNRRKAILNNIQALLKRYEEALNPRELGVPTYHDLEIFKKQIENQQLLDKPDRR